MLFRSAFPGVLATPLVVVGETEPLHVRVDIDEHESWRVRPGARAEAVLRGNASLRVALEFVRIEPFVVPKRSLTGDSTERVDTRVLQAIYRFRRGTLPFFVGQQVDVFIEATPAETPATGHPQTPPGATENKTSANHQEQR